LAPKARLDLRALTGTAQNRKLTATVRLEAMGLANKSITLDTSMPAELTFATLMQMYQSMDQIKRAIWAAGTTVHPACPLLSGSGKY
jgi:hypothetical protein